MTTMLLRVLPGWPEPDPVSNLHLVVITVLAPLLLGLVVAAIAWGPKLMQRNRHEAAAAGLADPLPEPDQPELAAGSPVRARHAELEVN